MGKITFKLRNYLEERNIKPFDVENEARRLGYKFGQNSIYRLLKDDGPENFNRTTLTTLIETLRSLTKRKVKLTDLIDYESED